MSVKIRRLNARQVPVDELPSDLIDEVNKHLADAGENLAIDAEHAEVEEVDLDVDGSPVLQISISGKASANTDADAPASGPKSVQPGVMVHVDKLTGERSISVRG